MFGRRQRDDDRDGARWDQADGRSNDFVDPWADQDHNGPPGDDGYWREPDDWAGNGSNGQRRPGGRGPGGQGPGGPGLAGPPLSGPGGPAQGFGDSQWGEPRPAQQPDPEEGPFGRRAARNDQRDNYRDNFRDDPRDNPRDGLPDHPRDGLRDSALRDSPLRDSAHRDNGGPAGRHSTARPDRRERDADAWGQPEPDMPVPEFIPTAIAPPAPQSGFGTSRPFGRLQIFTLHEDRAAEFDRLAEQAAEDVRHAEPDTLVYVFHTVPSLPTQRIIYEIYRDRGAFESHQRQPHIQRFTDEAKSCVLSSNVIDLRLKYAKVAPLQGAGHAGGGQSAAAPPSGGQSLARFTPAEAEPSAAATARFTPAGRADYDPSATPTARHRAPRSLETARRSQGDDRQGNWFGNQAGPAGGGRRGEPVDDDWSSGRDWGRS